MARNSNGELSGVWTALATPFKANMSLDLAAFERLLSLQSEAHVAGIVVSGTTGESPTLSVQEKISLVRKARVLLDRSVRIMVGTGGSNTEQSVELSKLAVDAGADSLLVVTPPYNKPSPAGLKLHFEAIATAVKVPVCLYHVPGRTAQTLSPGVIADICSIPGVRAVKEASGDLALFSRALMASGDAVFLSGDDPTYLASLAVGGKGVISVGSNIYPKEFVRLTLAFAEGKTDLALRLHSALLPAIDALFCEVNPAPLKAALHHLGLAENILRAPLAPITAASHATLIKGLNATHKALAELGS